VDRVAFDRFVFEYSSFFSVITSWRDVQLLINVVGRRRNWLLNGVRTILYTKKKTWCKPPKSFVKLDSIFASSDLMYVSTPFHQCSISIRLGGMDVVSFRCRCSTDGIMLPRLLNSLR